MNSKSPITKNNTAILVRADQLNTFISSALKSAGLPDQDAAKVAGLMADADLQGSDGHGMIR